MLRVKTLNSKNEIVEKISFRRICISNDDHNHLKSSFGNTNGWHVESSVMNPANLNKWTITCMPVGFKKVCEIKPLVTDAPVSNNAVTKVTSARSIPVVFLDELTAISIFIEPYNQSHTEGSLQQGAWNIVGKRQG